jgi:hypothetical protein
LQKKGGDPSLINTHCFLHPEALIVKSVDRRDLADVLRTAIKMIHSIKCQPVKNRLFPKLYSDMGAEHKTLLLHTEMPKVAPRQNFELCPGATGRNALIFWDRES